MSHLGALSLPINYRLATDEVGYICDNAEARLLVCDEEFAATASGLPHLRLVDVAAGDWPRPASRLPGGALTRPDDLFRLMYTSGTTDRPKGVMHSYSNFYWKSADHVIALGLSAADRLLVAGPFITSAPSTCPAWRCCGLAGPCRFCAISRPSWRWQPSPKSASRAPGSPR